MIESNDLILSITYITNVNEVLLEYYRIFAKLIKHLEHALQLSDFYNPSEEQENYLLHYLLLFELLLATVVTGLAIYVLYRHLK